MASSGPMPFSYVAPRRRHWWNRIEIVEYAGQVIPGPMTTQPDGSFSASFTATGPLSRTIHARRFWLMWSVKRYLERLKADRHV